MAHACCATTGAGCICYTLIRLGLSIQILPTPAASSAPASARTSASHEGCGPTIQRAHHVCLRTFEAPLPSVSTQGCTITVTGTLNSEAAAVAACLLLGRTGGGVRVSESKHGQARRTIRG